MQVVVHFEVTRYPFLILKFLRGKQNFRITFVREQNNTEINSHLHFCNANHNLTNAEHRKKLRRISVAYKLIAC